MRSGLHLIYTSLLTISVLSSCALFILVVSEVLQAEENPVKAIDPSGLHNVSQKSYKHDPSEPDPVTQYGNELDEKKKIINNNKLTFPENLALNTVTTDGLPDTGQPPVLISLADNTELKDLDLKDDMFVNVSDLKNETTTFTTTKPDVPPETLFVISKPMEARLAAEPTSEQPPLTTESQTEDELEHVEMSPKPDTPQEDIPSFSEWAQKQLAEAEKETVLNHSTQPSHNNTNITPKSIKISNKNYASPACGAKIVAANPEAGSPSAILSPNKDEYMLNTCNSRIWFVVELCEPVQAHKIEIANFELFSSTPKDIAVYFSDRFPTRDWASVGQFTAQEMRDVQGFELNPLLFGKFIRVEMLSHHGSEHYCPISVFNVYGTSEFEVLEKENSHTTALDEDDDDDIIDITNAESEKSKNLFGSARDAVMSIMKKAAQVLVKTDTTLNVSSKHNESDMDNSSRSCCSPSHIIVCDNCSEALYNQVYEMISCHEDRLTKLLKQIFIKDTIKYTSICHPYGLEFKSTKTIEFSKERVTYMSALFPDKYIAALCNILAINEKKVVLNSSFESEEVAENINVSDTTQTDTIEQVEHENIPLPSKDNTSDNTECADANQIEKPTEKIPEIVIETEPIKEEAPQIKVDDTKVEEVEQITPPPETKVPSQEEEITENQKLAEKPTEVEPEKEVKPETNDKPKEVTEPKEEGGSDQLVIENDSFNSDMDQLTADPTPAGVLASHNQMQTQAERQKESVFLRLSNRVKTLERNLSLSGQYLEELSRRYKKQVEEMQKTFLQMTEERKKSNEREIKYLEQMSQMQEQIAQITKAVKLLMDERDSWFGNVTFFKLVVFQIITAAVFFYALRRRQAEPFIVPLQKKVKKKEKIRRKSVEGVSGHATPASKKRRPSEEALHITRHSADEIYDNEDDGEWQLVTNNKTRKRKSSILHRHSEINWGRQDSIGVLRENPITLDEEEYLAPVSEPREFNENIPPNTDIPKSNGSLFSTFKDKSVKTRRLSSPAFLRSFSRHSTRSIPSPGLKNVQPIFNGQVKASSESPTSSLWSASTDIPQENGVERTKKKKGFKNMFKKVF